MAAKQNEAAGKRTRSKDAKEVSPPGPTMPEGFIHAAPATGKPWYFEAFPGRVLRGILLGRFPRQNNSEQFYYQVELTEAASGIAKDAEGEYGELIPGDTVHLDERSGLRQLACYVPAEGSRWEVWVCAREKIDIKGGKSFWRFDVGAKLYESPDDPGNSHS